MITIDFIIVLLIITPICAAIASFLIYKADISSLVNLIFSLIQLTLSITLLLLWKSEVNSSIHSSLAGWSIPLGIGIYVDGISVVLACLTNVILFFVCIYSIRYFDDINQRVKFWPLFWLLATGLNAVFFASDIFNIYVILEIIGLSAVSLVALQGKKESLKAALRYLFIGLAGSLCYLLGVALLYRTYGVLDLTEISNQIEPLLINNLALGLMTAGLLFKTALFPFHFWLPSAHSSASSPVSAILSALVVKASFYLLMRFWFDSLEVATTNTGFQFLGVLGGLAIIFGSFQAYRAKRLKLVIAYSTVAQIGYLFLLFPIVRSHSIDINVIAPIIIYFIIAHATAKASIFLAAGNMAKSVGSDELTRLRGLVKHQPLMVASFAIAATSLIGLPPSGGFIGKWMMLESSIGAGSWAISLVLVIGGILAALYFIKILGLFFSSNPQLENTNLVKIPRVMSWSVFGLSLSTLVLGFSAPFIISQITSL